MKILLTGSTGLIGKALTQELLKLGHALNYLVRKLSKEHDYLWSIDQGTLDHAALDGVEAIIHLAGEPVVGLRWSAAKRRRILESRIRSTALIFESVRKLSKKPTTFICASAIGIYGDRGEEVLLENSTHGAGFLSEVVQSWESQALQFEGLGIRVVNLRFGVVLSSTGGALKLMLPAFRLGVGGRLGNGKQYMSWVSLQDVVQAIIFALDNKNVNGPINVVAPGALRNKEFTTALAKALKRPVFCHMPAFVLKLLLGQMAEEMLLSSARVEPKKLIEAGFGFKDVNIGTYFLSELR